MKKCPFCAEVIKDEAIKCKHCGADLVPQVVTPTAAQTVVVKPKEGLFLRTLNGGCAVIFIIIIIIAIIIFASSK